MTIICFFELANWLSINHSLTFIIHRQINFS